MPEQADTKRRSGVLKRALHDPDYELLVAELEREIVGFVDQWVIYDFPHGATLSFIQNLFVSLSHRRKGIGRTLLREIIKSAKAKGVLETHTATEFDNKPAIELYKKQGLVKESLLLEMELE